MLQVFPHAYLYESQVQRLVGMYERSTALLEVKAMDLWFDMTALFCSAVLAPLLRTSLDITRSIKNLKSHIINTSVPVPTSALSDQMVVLTTSLYETSVFPRRDVYPNTLLWMDAQKEMLTYDKYRYNIARNQD